MIRSHQVVLNQIFIFFDGLIIAFAVYLAWVLKFDLGLLGSKESVEPQTYFVLGAGAIFLYILTNAMFGLYSPQRTRRIPAELFQLGQSTFVFALTLTTLLFFLKEVHVSRIFLVLFVLLAFIFLAAERIGLRLSLRQFRAMGYNKKFVLIIGAGPLGRKALQMFKDNREFGYEVMGFVDDYLYPSAASVQDIPLIGKSDDVETILNRQLVDQVILALPMDAHHRLKQIISVCEKAGVQLLIIPDYFKYLPARPQFEEIGGIPMIDIRHVPLDNAVNAGLKRAFDIVFSIIALILCSPLFFLIGAGLKISSPGPIFFVQERVGKNRRIFKMYKFRTMHVSSEASSDTQWTRQNDPRRTPLGAFLRKTSLDELPQFYNVLKGEMSIIGPRPERPFFIEQFKEDIPKYMIRHRVRPGITGWAQVNGWRGDTSIVERINCDIDYIENWTLGLDVKIAVRTLVSGFRNKNAY